MSRITTLSSLVLLALFLILGGGCKSQRCSHFAYGEFENFDDWYVGGDLDFDPKSVGFKGLDNRSSFAGFGGYVVNEILIRTPVFVAHDLTKLAVAPVAGGYYAAKRIGD